MHNEGAVFAPATVARLYDGNPDSGGTQIGADLAIPTLAPNAAVTLAPVWDTLNLPGAHSLYVVVDPANSLTEASKIDNRANVAVTVAAAPAGVDLTFGTPDITAMPAQPNRLPTTVGLSVTVRNLGLTNASNVVVRVWAGAPGTTLMGEQTVNVLARSSQAVNFTHMLTDPGSVNYTVQLDPGNAVVEANEANNSKSIVVATVPSIDLVTTAADICVNQTNCSGPAGALMGEDVAFTVTLRNEGTSNTPSTQVRYTVTDGNQTRVLGTNSLQLNAGRSTQQTVTWRVDLSGALVFAVQLDPEGLLPELDEANNIATRSLTGGSITGANLVVTHQEFTATPTPNLLEGQPATLTAVVRNTGTLAANGVLVQFYNGDPAQGGVLLGASTIPTIASGGQQTVTYNWPLIADSADKLVFVVVNADNNVPETADNDNTAFNVFTVKGLPDLAIASGDIQLTPAFPRAGESTLIAAKVSNLGAQNAVNVEVRAYAGDPASGGTQIGAAQIIPAIAGPSGSVVVNFPWAPGAAVGGRSIYIVVDPAVAITERTKANNSARRDIVIQDADMFVTERYFSPDNNGVKDSTSLSFRLSVQQTVTVEVVDKLDRVVRLFRGTGLINVSSGTIAWDGLDSMGRVAADGTYRMRVVSTMGDNLGEALVEVDNNRSSLLAAVGTRYQATSNLTCGIRDDYFYLRYVTSDGTTFFSRSPYVAGGDESIPGIWRVNPDGSDLRRILSRGQAGLFNGFNVGFSNWAMSSDGSIGAVYEYSAGSDHVVVFDGEGKNVRDVYNGNYVHWLGLSPDGRYAYVKSRTGPELIQVPTNGTSPPRTITGVEAVTENQRYDISPKPFHSPDGRKLLLVVEGSGEGYDNRSILVDAESGTAIPVGPLEISWNKVEWSGNGAYFVTRPSDGNALHLYDSSGTLLKVIESPVAEVADVYRDIGATTFNWSSSDVEFAFTVDAYPSTPPDQEPFTPSELQNLDPGGIFVYNVETQQIRRIASMASYTGEAQAGEGWYYPRVASGGIAPGSVAQWVPGERVILATANEPPQVGQITTRAIFLDEDNAIRDMPGEPFNDSYHFPPGGRVVTFSSTRDAGNPASACFSGQNHADLHLFRSLLNLTADFRAVRSAKAGGIQMRGTAADLNFATYSIDYAPVATPNAWLPAAPSSGAQAVDELLTTWVPPAHGTYFVRLTATDLAGNTRRTTRRVSWSDSPSLTNVFRAPAITSPNGDGVNDTVSINYRVLEPVHFAIEVYDSLNRRVRLMERDHTQIGVDFNVNWDGRDDNGIVVPDGRYKLVVQNFEFQVTVDATPPLALLTLRDAYQQLIVDNRSYASAQPGFYYQVEDPLLADTSIEFGRGEDPTSWQPASQAQCYPQWVRPPQTNPLYTTSHEFPDRTCSQVALDDAINTRYRLVARDQAGNSTTTITPMFAEQLMLLRLGDHKLAKQNCSLDPAEAALCNSAYKPLQGVSYYPLDPSSGGGSLGGDTSVVSKGDMRMYVSDTLRASIGQLFVQYRKDGTAEWSEAPLSVFYGRVAGAPPTAQNVEFLSEVTPSGHFRQPVWNMAGIEPGGTYTVRLRAVDGSGNAHLSNTARFRTDGFVWRGEVIDVNADEDLPAVYEARAVRDGETAFWGQEFVVEPILSMRLLVQSDDDTRYKVQREVDRVEFVDRVFVFKVADLRACKHYNLTVEIEVQEGADSLGNTIRRTATVGPFDYEFKCLEIDRRVEPLQSAQCGAEPPNRLRFALTPASKRGAALTLLTLSKPLSDGSDDILYNVNRPTSGKLYEFEIDTAGIPDSRIPFTARLIDEFDNVHTVTWDQKIDHTPASVEWNYPQEGQRLCGIPRTMPDGSIRNAVTFDGLIDDDGGLSYRVKQVDEGGAETTFHDSEGINSLGEKPQAAKPYTLKRQAGPFAEIFNRTGEVTAKLEVDDYSGFRQCTTRTFYLDGSVDGAAMAASVRLFSPITDEAQLTYEVDETVTVRIDVFLAQMDPARGYLPVGDSLRTLLGPVQAFAGQSTVTWNGRNSAGSVVADGAYVVIAEFRDACGNLARKQAVVAVDATPPVVTLDYPTAGAVLPLIVEVQGSVTDAHPQSFAAEFGVGSDPETWSSLGAGRSTEGVRIVGRWNTAGLEGQHVVRIRAVDAAGNERIVTVPVNLAERLTLISNLEPVPELFSPNADGRRETTAIRYQLDNAATVTLDVQTLGGSLVRRLISAQSLQAGPAVVSWDGLNNLQQPVADGEYDVILRATLASNPLVQQEEKVRVTLDKTAPVISVTRPNGAFVSGSGALVGTIVDARMQRYEATLTRLGGGAAETLVKEEGPQQDAILGSLEDREEGDYSLRVTAVDEAENQSATTVNFTIDNTRPVVTLTSPDARIVASALKGAVVFSGSIEEANLQNYRLRYGAGASPSTWTDFASGTELPLPAVLHSWNVAAVSDGVYTVELLATDRAGLTGAARVQVTVDNTPPAIALTQPAAMGYVTKQRSLTGTVTDANFDHYVVEMASGTATSATQFVEILRGAQPVSAGSLGPWEVLPPDGIYTVRLTAKDQGDNIAELRVQVTVDDTPPPTPLNLIGSIEGRTAARLRWDAVAVPDLAGYHVFRNGTRITTAPVNEVTYLDSGLAEATYQYEVVAVDAAGLESERSNRIEVAVDLTPPTARIGFPSDSGRVGGFIDILGTAQANQDFREYRLYVGQGANSTDLQLLRQSPVQKQGESLAEWNTVVLPEGAVFTLRLEADDINGNTAVHQLNVTIDNLPPAAPTGLVAVATGANVALTWNANSESDLLGYLLYRDERLANQTGVAIVDLRPYAVVTTQYPDNQRPDGTSEYYLLAIDKAGNVSDPSSAVQVTIDTHAPSAVIVTPANNSAFEGPLYVLAETPDTDIRHVQMQYRAQGSTTWLNLGSQLTAAPYEYTLLPGAENGGLNLARGAYQLRAVATDLGNRTDANPAAITVTYKDLNRPSAVTGATRTVNGGQVTLNWTPNSDTDLAGYFIERGTSPLNMTRITPTAIVATTFVDASLADANYQYRIIAVDTAQNEADAVTLDARVYTPALLQPYTPSAEPSVLLTGSGPVPATLQASLSNITGTTNFPPQSLTAALTFALPEIALSNGENTVTVRLTDAAGDVSKPALVKMIRAAPPIAPVNLQAVANGNNVSLTWDANPETNIAGYLPYRFDVGADDFVPIQDPVMFTFSSAQASQEEASAPASHAIDGSNGTYWGLFPEIGDSSVGHWISFKASAPRWIDHFDMRFIYYSNTPRRFDIEARFADVWVPIAKDVYSYDNWMTIQLPRPYYTDEVRLVIRELQYPDSPTMPIYMSDFRAYAVPLQASPAYNDTALAEGSRRYAVSAINTFGIEGPHSTPAQIRIGEELQPVVLSGAVVGLNDVSLSWTESASPNVDTYAVYRDGGLMTSFPASEPRTFVDTGVANGDYVYTVTARRGPENESAHSNPYNAVIAVTVPTAPTNLVVTTPAVSGTLDLAWTPGTGSSNSGGFVIERSTSASGPFESAGFSMVPAFRDYGLVSGQTYWYRVYEQDSFGNRGVNSNIASGVPVDLQAPVVALHYPTTPGRLLITSVGSTNIVARTEPGSNVRLMRGGVVVRETVAASTASAVSIPLEEYMSTPVLSSDGRAVTYSTYEDGYRVLVRDLATGAVTQLATTENTEPRPSWSASGNEIYYVDRSNDTSQLVALRLADRSKRVVASSPSASIDVYSFGGSDSRLIIYDSSQDELSEVDLSTGEFRALPRVADGYNVVLSPDGSRYAHFAYNDQGAELRVVHIDTGTSAVVATSASQQALAWSHDGASLAYLGYNAEGAWNVFTYTFSTGITTQRGLDEDHYSVIWAPDGQALALSRYLDEGSRVDLLDIAMDTMLPLAGSSTFDVMQWSASGYFLAWRGDDYARVTPPGRVEFASIPLDAGDNVFTASAVDTANNQGQVSAAVVVSRVAQARPDLIIDDANVRVLPAAPLVGESTRLSVTVRNGGTAAAAASGVTIMVIAPDGTTSVLRDNTAVGGLAVQQRQAFNLDFLPANGAGTYTVVAIADPSGVVTELSEANNFGVAEFSVIAEAGQQLVASTNLDTYNAGDTVLGNVVLRNFGAAITGRLSLTIEDSQGFVVQTFPDVPITAMPFNGSRTEQLSWSTGATFAGAYQLHARLLDAGGAQLAESRAMFLIVAASSFSASVNTDRASYATGEGARIEGTFNYLSGNTPVSGATATLRIVDASNAVVAERVQALGDLLPNSSGQISLDWTTTAVGNYRAELRLTQGAELLAGAQTLFAVEAGAAQLTGTISLSEQAPGAGTPQVASWRVNNVAGAGVNQLPIILSLVAQDSPTPIVTERVTRDIASGGNTTGLQTYDTAALRLQQYSVLLQAEVSDGSQTRLITLATAAFNVADRAPPVVAVRAPAVNGFVPTGASASIFARDALSSVREVSFTITADNWFGASTTVAEESLYGGLLGTLADGDYTITARATDAFGNTGVSTPVAFVVDTTPPSIDITGAQSNGVYTTPVTLSVTANDAHLDGVVATLDGADYSGAVISSAGTHRLVVSAVDLAGNRSSQTLEFTINLGGDASPVISVTGVANGGQYTATVTPLITVTDADNDSPTFTATLNGAPYTSGTPVTTDGSYTLVVNAVDAANHTATLTLSFALDQTAPLVSVQSPAPNAQLRGTPTVTLQATDNVALANVSFSVDGGVFVTASSAGGIHYSGELGTLADGPHTVAARAIDTFGNVADTADVPFVVDNTAPVVAITGVANGGVYGDSVTATISVTDANLLSSTSLLDGAVYVSGTPITTAGAHQLVVTGTDMAGNVTTTTLDFSIENAVPVIAISGVAEGGRYTAAVTPVITVTDTDSPTYHATLNGATFTSGSQISTDGAYTLVVNARDAAGNEASLTLQFALDATLPTISVQQPVAGSILRGALATTLQAQDASGLAQVQFSVDGGIWNPAAVQDANAGLYAGALGMLVDGPHSLTGRAIDDFGNTATSAAVAFVVDNTAPLIAIAGVVDGGAYNDTVTPQVTVTDANLETATILLDGQAYSSGTAIVAGGAHVLSVTARDRAGNESASQVAFTIASAAPVITVTGVEQGGRYNGDVTPVITITDTDSFTSNITLNGNTFVSGTAVTGTGAYTLSVNADDAGGNHATLTLTFEVDKVAPAVSVLQPAAGAYLRGAIATTIQAQDANGVAQVAFSLDGGTWTAAAVQDAAAGLYVGMLGAPADGAHTMAARATDNFGNVTTSAAISFTVDNLAPSIGIAGVAEGGQYADGVTPVITVTDANLLSTSSLLDGAPYVAGTAISAAGVHTIVVTATDRAGNEATGQVSFTVTNAAPVITVTGVANDGRYTANVTPVITVTDTDTFTYTATLNGAAYVSGTAITSDGSYVLVVNAEDSAGNDASVTVQFALDKTLPSVSIQQPVAGSYLRGAVNAVLQAQDAAGVSQVQYRLNLGPWVPATVQDAVAGLYGAALGNLADGIYTLDARSTDAFGNISAITSAAFTVDNTAPVIALTGAAEGGRYNTVVTVNVAVTEANPATQTVTLNGAAYVPGTAITADGTYLLAVTATDRAGNSSTHQINFLVDRQPPVITVTGVVQGGAYANDVTPVITVTDANNPTYTATLNGAAFTSGTVVQNDGSYTLAVHAQDDVGNVADLSLQFAIASAPEPLPLNITSPANNTTTTQPSIDVTGTTAPLATVDLNVGSFQVTGTANASGQFSFTQVPLVAGSNVITARARDASGNTSGPVSVTVTADLAPPITLTSSPIEHHGTLVWLDSGETCDCRITGKFGQLVSTTGNCSPTRYTPLTSLLQSSFALDGSSYLIVHSQSNFVAALRSQRYDSIVLAELHGNDGSAGPLGMTFDTTMELKAAVSAGSGLAWVRNIGDTNDHLNYIFGAKPNGTASNRTQLVLPESVASSAGTWTISGQIMKMTLTSGLRVGSLNSGNHPAMSVFQYGDGRTVMMGFDPSRVTSPQGALDVMGDVLDYVRPGAPPTSYIAGGVATLRWSATELPTDREVELQVQLPTGFKLLEADGVGELVSARTARWRLTPTSSSMEFRLVARVPIAAGAYLAEGDLSTMQPAGMELAAQSDVTVEVTGTAAAAAAATLTYLNGLSVPSSYRSYLTNAKTYVTQAKNRTQGNLSDATYSLNKTRAALEQILYIVPDQVQARVKIGDLLRHYAALFAARSP